MAGNFETFFKLFILFKARSIINSFKYSLILHQNLICGKNEAINLSKGQLSPSSSNHKKKTHIKLLFIP